MPVTQPTGYPAWASGPSGWIVEPLATVKAMGWQPGQAPPAGYENWLDNLTYNWIRYLHQSIPNPLLGDGSDGDLILTGATSFKMSRHMMLGNLVIGPSGALDTNGFIPYVRGVLTGVSGTIRCNGSAGGTGNASAIGLGGAGRTGPLSGGWGSGTGGIGPTGSGESVLNSLGGTGGVGAGTIASPGAPVGPTGVYRAAPAAVDGFVKWWVNLSSQAPGGQGGATLAPLRGGGGGSYGAVSSPLTAPGGGGGAGGGVVLIPAAEVNFIGTVEVRGGDGGADGVNASNQFKGGGGGGGWAMFAYGIKTNLSVFLNSAPGSGCSGLPAASTGATGIIEVKLTY